MKRTFAAQAWLAWGLAASFVVLAGRNPFVFVLVGCILLIVREFCPGRGVDGAGWSVVLRSTILLATVSVLFNVLTTRAGDRVLVVFPDWVPLIDGNVTLNAIVFGLLSAIAIVLLVLIWATVSLHISWIELERIVPDRLTGFAVAGASAINLIPQTTRALGDIREACLARGMIATRPRDFTMLLAPMVNVGLERSMQLSDVLAARGFGATIPAEPRRQTRHAFAWTMLLAGGVVSAYGALARLTWPALAGLCAVVAGGVLIWIGRDNDVVRRTRYRESHVILSDWILIGASCVAAAATLLISALSPDAIHYDPYPVLQFPVFAPVMLIPIGFLVAPAVLQSFQATADD